MAATASIKQNAVMEFSVVNGISKFSNNAIKAIKIVCLSDEKASGIAYLKALTYGGHVKKIYTGEFFSKIDLRVVATSFRFIGNTLNYLACAPLFFAANPLTQSFGQIKALCKVLKTSALIFIFAYHGRIISQSKEKKNDSNWYNYAMMASSAAGIYLNIAPAFGINKQYLQVAKVIILSGVGTTLARNVYKCLPTIVQFIKLNCFQTVSRQQVIFPSYVLEIDIKSPQDPDPLMHR